MMGLIAIFSLMVFIYTGMLKFNYVQDMLRAGKRRTLFLQGLSYAISVPLMIFAGVSILNQHEAFLQEIFRSSLLGDVGFISIFVAAVILIRAGILFCHMAILEVLSGFLHNKVGQ